MTILITVFLGMLPVYFGYLFLFTWPIWVSSYLGIIALIQGVQSRRKLAILEKDRGTVAVWDLLNRRSKVPWMDISSSIELSCKGQTVRKWMGRLGVLEVDNLKTDRTSTFSNSFPSDYDLVTNIIDDRNPKDLRTLYRQASDYLKKGGIFIDLERSRCGHQIDDHIAAAGLSGLRLSERSDRPVEPNQDMSLGAWLPDLKNLNRIMLVWTKA